MIDLHVDFKVDFTITKTSCLHANMSKFAKSIKLGQQNQKHYQNWDGPPSSSVESDDSDKMILYLV